MSRNRAPAHLRPALESLRELFVNVNELPCPSDHYEELYRRGLALAWAYRVNDEPNVAYARAQVDATNPFQPDEESP